MFSKKIILFLLVVLPISLFCQDTLQKETKTRKILISHQLCFGTQWIKWAYGEYNNAHISYLKQSYLCFYKVVLESKKSIIKFAVTFNGAYTTGEGYFSSYGSSLYRESYKGKFENYWININPCVYFALGKRKNILLGGGPFYGRLLHTQNDIKYTIREEPIGAPPTSTTTANDKILNRASLGATIEAQQKIMMNKSFGIVIGLRLLLTSIDGFVATLVPAINPYIGIGF